MGSSSGRRDGRHHERCCRRREVPCNLSGHAIGPVDIGVGERRVALERAIGLAWLPPPWIPLEGVEVAARQARELPAGRQRHEILIDARLKDLEARFWIRGEIVLGGISATLPGRERGHKWG